MNQLQIFYGNDLHKVNITSLLPITHDIIYIHATDEVRQFHYNNRINGKKFIYVTLGTQELKFDDTKELYIHINTMNITIRDITLLSENDKPIYDKLMKIHSVTKFKFGSLLDELPEQIMSINFLTGNEKILEIGGNFGRNSMIIAYILNNSSEYVVMESDQEIAKKLEYNRDINNYLFHIEVSALSKYNMIQNGWTCIKSDIEIPGYNKVHTISYNDLCKKYNIEFDTLVLDCEGAFYDILLDMPEILNNINLILIENDFSELTKKQYVDTILLANNFKVIYSMPGGWGPCQNNFYEVWKKI